jgi:hypothetical protein
MAREELIALLYRYILAEWIDDEQNSRHRQNDDEHGDDYRVLMSFLPRF